MVAVVATVAVMAFVVGAGSQGVVRTAGGAAVATPTPVPTPGAAYSYDAAGRLTQVVYGSGRRVLFTYDAAGNILTRRVVGALPSGDANGDGTINVGDVFYLINALFAGGPPAIGPGDVNGDGQVNVGDVFYLINYLFAGGPPPV